MQVSMAKINNNKMTVCDSEDVGEGNTHSFQWGFQLVQSLFKPVRQYLRKLE